MFTLKLYREVDGTIMRKMVEGAIIDVYTLRPGALLEISVKHGASPGSDISCYYLSAGGKRLDGFADEVIFWSEAFIENSVGKTSEHLYFAG